MPEVPLLNPAMGVSHLPGVLWEVLKGYRELINYEYNILTLNNESIGRLAH